MANIKYKIIKVIKSLIYAGIVSCATLQVGYALEELDKLVAVVNGHPITWSELNKYTDTLLAKTRDDVELPPREEIIKQVLERMINENIQMQLAKDAGIEVDNITVSEAIKSIAKQRNNSVAELQQAVTDKGLNFDEYRDNLKNEITISRLQNREIQQNIYVTKADIDGFLKSPAGQDASGTEYHLGHILIPIPEQPTPDAIAKTQAKAEKITQELKDGAEFSKVAMRNSAAQHAFQGGDLGWKKISELPSLFVKPAVSMEIKQIYGPLRNATGFHIISLFGKRTGQIEERIETHVRQILIKPSINTSDLEAKKNLEEMRHQIISNKIGFAKLAEQKSEELNTAAVGGDLGWVTDKSLLNKFAQTMHNLPVNKVSEPFKTEMGWHIIEVLGRRSQKDSIEALRNKAKEIIEERKFNEYLDSWLHRIRDNAEVEVFL